MTRTAQKCLLCAALCVALTSHRHHSSSNPKAVPPPPPQSPQHTFTVLAGSELGDVEKDLKTDIRNATGIDLVFTYAATLDAFRRVAAGDKFDALWVSQGKYLALNNGLQDRILAQEKIMLSPVVLGLKASKAHALGWDIHDPTWKEIADAARAGEFTYGMANPASSNTGLSATIGLAAALAQTSDALTEADLKNPGVTDFFHAQSLTSDSSQRLAEAYERDPSSVDGIIDYESVLLSLNASGKLAEPLTLVYPKEGIITADYPLMLLNAAKRTDYDNLVAYLRSKAFQTRLSALTLRRPINPDASMAGAIPRRTLMELPFPAQPGVIAALIHDFPPDVRIPASSRYVLDLSDSMAGRRVASLKQAMLMLASGSGDRDEIGIITFSAYPAPTAFFSLGADLAQNARTRASFAQFIEPLKAAGPAAVYDSIRQAVTELAAERAAARQKRCYSVVLITGGQSTSGISYSEFNDWYQSQPDVAHIPVFPILFGEGNAAEFKQLADLTGGRLFDSRSTPLAEVFKEIRGYQ